MASEPYDPYVPSGQGGSSSTAKLREELDAATAEARYNVQALAQRGEMVDSLADKTTGLAQTSSLFNRSSNKLRKAEWYRHQRMKVLLAVGIIALLAIIIIPAVVFTRK
ncbi:synaptobrevin [Canariomyces notabilis]|uniref:Synaptobrevin n=1 Tax=Canariomyces notabilis TaxID=2074819 RepID=A0AAN6TPF5_9PEZI|nr:synaptobrevin [Canariomyces arenarius]